MKASKIIVDEVTILENKNWETLKTTSYRHSQLSEHREGRQDEMTLSSKGCSRFCRPTFTCTAFCSWTRGENKQEIFFYDSAQVLLFCLSNGWPGSKHFTISTIFRFSPSPVPLILSSEAVWRLSHTFSKSQWQDTVACPLHFAHHPTKVPWRLRGSICTPKRALGFQGGLNYWLRKNIKITGKRKSALKIF